MGRSVEVRFWQRRQLTNSARFWGRRHVSGSRRGGEKGWRIFTPSRYSTGKPITEFGDRFNVLLMLWCVAESLAQGRDVHGQVGLFYKTVRPDFPHEFVFCYKLPVSFNQCHEDVKRFRSERDGFSCTQQRVIRRIKAKSVEFIK